MDKIKEMLPKQIGGVVEQRGDTFLTETEPLKNAKVLELLKNENLNSNQISELEMS
jgi:hypothetical protein